MTTTRSPVSSVIDCMNENKEKIRVERFCQAHLSDVAALEGLCFAEPWSEESLRLLLGETAVGFVVTEAGRAVAYGGMLCVAGEGQITNIAVHPDCRRRGFGRAVTEALLDFARERGLCEVSLEVRESNEAAIALYRLLGFTACGVRRNFYQRPTENALVMLWHAADGSVTV